MGDKQETVVLEKLKDESSVGCDVETGKTKAEKVVSRDVDQSEERRIVSPFSRWSYASVKQFKETKLAKLECFSSSYLWLNLEGNDSVQSSPARRCASPL